MGGERIVLVCQSFSSLNKIFDYLFHSLQISEEEFKNTHRLYIGENPSRWKCDGLKKRGELEDVSNSWKKFNLLAYTSTISIGVDFSDAHFSKIIGIFKGSLGLDPDFFLQGLLWVWNPTGISHTLFLPPRSLYAKHTNPLSLHKNLRKTLGEMSALLDSCANTANGLWFCLLARKNLLYAYG